jgi:SAM-dependent methyltransferase
MLPADLLRADPHGAAMLDFLDGRYDGSFSYVRDDDLATPFDIATRFAGYAAFTAAERDACGWAAGRVLDVGCGSGKHVLGLRGLGLDCTGIDVSPVVAYVWRRQRLTGMVLMDAFRLAFADRAFDTVTLFANGLSMGGSMDGVRHLLTSLARVTGPRGRAVVTNVSASASTRQADRRYHAANIAAGRLPGQLVLHCRYRGVDGPSFPWLFLAPEELAEAVVGLPWRLEEVRQHAGGTYCALLGKQTWPSVSETGSRVVMDSVSARSTARSVRASSTPYSGGAPSMTDRCSARSCRPTVSGLCWSPPVVSG